MGIQRIDITLADGRVRTVTPNLMDRIAFESHLRVNRHLGGLAENPIRFSAFTAWSALRREDPDAAGEWDEFLAGKALSVEPSRDDPADETEEAEGLGEGMSGNPLTS